MYCYKSIKLLYIKNNKKGGDWGREGPVLTHNPLRLLKMK